MNLTYLELKRFRSFTATKIPLGAPRVLIAGLNGSGKSTIRDSIRWALTGHCEGTDAKGAGAEVLIPVGEKTADVIIDVAGIGAVARSFTEKTGGGFSIFGFTGTSQVQQQALYFKLQTTPQFLDAVLDTAVFLDLNHAEAKALVLGLLNVKIPVGDQVFTLDEVDQQYKVAFDDRKAAKKSFAGCVVPPMPEAQMPTIEKILGQLTMLREALGAARQEAGTVIGRRNALLAALSQHAVLSEPEEDLTEAIAGAESSLSAIEAEVVPAAEPAKGDPSRVVFLRSRQAAILEHVPSNGCVLGFNISCLTPAKQFQMAVGDINAELAKLTPPAQNVATESPLTAARRHLTLLQTRQQRREATLAANQREQDRLEAARQELAQLPETAQAEADIAGLEARIRKGEDLLTSARSHWQAVERHQQALEQQQALAADVERLEALVELLGPKGARATALSEAMGRFQDAVNPYLKPFGWTISFSVEPWQVFANKRPVETYSKSERFRIGIALQMGIAMLSGLKFAVIDELDMLDVGNRKTVSQMLMQAPLDQIIFLGTREPSQPLPNVPGALAYRLEMKDGRSVVAEKSAA